MSKTNQAQREIALKIVKRVRDLADTIANNKENTLDFSDSALCATALRAYAAQIEAGFALISPPPRIG